jgi:hypothetical protein
MRLAALTLVVVTALGIAGYGPRATIPTLPPEPSGTPLFESEEEALAAAEAAYTAYLATSDLIANEGGVDPERIAAVATGDLHEDAIEGFEILREQNWHSVGQIALAGISLQYADLNGDRKEEVLTAYVCIDLGAVDVLDASGESVVSPSRSDRQAFEVTFDLETESQLLVPSARTPWDGGGVCA